MMRRNLGAARFNRAEAAGALGDLGTFLPLLVGMAATNGLNFAAGLFFAGVFSIVTGLLFSVPLAVQPMKAIAAVAIAEGLTPGEIVGAGAMVSAVVLVLGLTGLIDALHRLVPRSVVRGLQLALGLSLLMKGLGMVAGTGVMLAPDGYLTGILATVGALVLLPSRRVPAALVLFGAGIAMAFWKSPGLAASLHPGLWTPRWSAPALADFLSAFPRAALPQIPLTTLNSVVAVCALSADLFPRRSVTPRRVAISVGLMNLIGCWFGAMPMCHGAGGLAGQYRFGARSNGAILMLGAGKTIMAVLFGASLMELCAAFPASILGVMLGISGVELALVARDQTRRLDALGMLVTAGACLQLGVAAGFGIGLAIVIALRYRPAADSEEGAA